MGKRKNDPKTRKKHVRLAKKIILITATLCGFITALWIGAQCVDMKEMARYYALAVTMITGLQFFEKRNSHWDWGYVIFLCVIYFVFAGMLIVFSEELALYWCFALWAVEFAGCLVFVITEHRKSKCPQRQR